MEELLSVRDLAVEAGSRKILRGMNLSVSEGETVILFGPNGSGKSTLIRTIMGLSGYHVESGEVRFRGRLLNALPTDERVRLGIGVMYQNPPRIRGVTLGQIARFLTKDEQRVRGLAATLSLTALLERDINYNFSGGEIKRAELFQLLLQDPELLLLDEPESGVDIENVTLMGRVLGEFLRRPGKAALIITHTGYILDFVDAGKGCVMLGGKFWCLNDPKDIFATIKEYGYERCISCNERKGLR